MSQSYLLILMYEINGKVTIIGNPILKMPGAPIEHFNMDLKRLFEKMTSITREKDGIGIAAQQVGLALRCCVVDTSESPKDPQDFCILDGESVDIKSISPLWICNPEFSLSGPISTYKEGCLSIPRFYFDVQRPQIITAKFQTETGVFRTLSCNGLLARCLQHEFDHLNGTLFTDLISVTGRKKLERFFKNNSINCGV